MPTTDLNVTGMNCASCVAHVEKALQRVEGVEDATVNLTTGRARVQGRGIVGSALVESVTKAGFGAELIGDKAHTNHAGRDTDTDTDDDADGVGAKPQAAHDHDHGPAAGFFSRATALRRALWTLPLVAGLMALMWVHTAWSPGAQLALCSIVMVVLGWPFFKSAARGLRFGRVDMDTLVALGSGVAFVASVVELFRGHDMLHFGTAGAILWFITLGHALEHKARRAAASAIAKLRDLAPDTATLVEFGREREVPLDQVTVGQTVLIKPGGRVPLDGQVTQGNSTIDQSMVTGESVPVDIAEGGKVFAGTINQTGSLRIQVTATGGQTLLGQIVEMVEQAQTGKASVQRLADKVAGVFVPIVILIAISSYLFWWLAMHNGSHGLVAAVAVLIVACPCALGLAVPTAILVGTGIGAERGILIKDPAALERAGNLGVIILDKTGTLTTGKPSVANITVHDSATENSKQAALTDDALLRYAAAVEQDSEHPLGKAIVREANRREIALPPVTQFASITAAGVSGSVEGKVVKVGRLSALREAGVEVPDGFERLFDRNIRASLTIVAVAVDNRAVGFIGLADEIRGEAADAVTALKKLGLTVLMMTGDSQFAADLVAKKLGIDRTLAEVKPADKRDEVIRQQAMGKSVAMVGDGINDAPALAEADIGIAIGGGTDIARDAGHVVLVGGDLMNLPAAIRLGRATMRRITFGLIWASVYNLALIPLAAAGILHPMFAAGAMSLSSVSVVVNALWLRWTWKG